MRIQFFVARVLVVLAILAAVGSMFAGAVSPTGGNAGLDRSAVVANFFSYFTIDSNLLSAIVLAIAAIVILRRPSSEPVGLTIARLSVTTYMFITGVVYNTLLRGPDTPFLWSNEIVHLVAPLYLLMDWFVAPGRSRLRARDAMPVLIFPIVWIAYTLIRGPFAVDPVNHTAYWYPYPFMNPVTSPGGYASVTIYLVVIAVVAIVVSVGFALLSGRRRTPADAAEATSR